MSEEQESRPPIHVKRSGVLGLWRWRKMTSGGWIYGSTQYASRDAAVRAAENADDARDANEREWHAA